MVAELTKQAIEATEFSRDLRNRHIAHRYLNLTMGKGAIPLKTASRAKVKDALAAIAAVLNAVSLHFTKTTLVFDLGSEPHGAASLLYTLDDGLRAKKERLARKKAGAYRPDDFEARNL